MHTYDTTDILRDKLSIHGELTVANHADARFSIKRLFWIASGPEETTRGGHAHKRCWQTFYCITGEVALYIHDHFGEYWVTVRPGGDSVVVPPGLWSKQVYAPNSTLLVACSEDYDEEEYIRDWKEFISWRTRSLSQEH